MQICGFVVILLATVGWYAVAGLRYRHAVSFNIISCINWILDTLVLNILCSVIIVYKNHIFILLLQSLKWCLVVGRLSRYDMTHADKCTFCFGKKMGWRLSAISNTAVTACQSLYISSAVLLHVNHCTFQVLCYW